MDEKGKILENETLLGRLMRERFKNLMNKPPEQWSEEERDRFDAEEAEIFEAINRPNSHSCFNDDW